MPETTGSAMKAKIQARVAWGERRLISSEMQASTTQITYETTKIWNHGISIMARSIECVDARHPHFAPVGRRHRPAAHRLHSIAGQVAALRSGVAAPWP